MIDVLEFLEVYLPICVNILLIILLIVGIILGVRLVGALDKVDAILDNVQGKINSLNGLFGAIDFTTSKISMFSDKVYDAFASLIDKISGKKKESKKITEDDDYE